MQIFGVEVNPYELFLILILLLAAAGAFGPRAARAGKKEPPTWYENPVKLLDSQGK